MKRRYMIPLALTAALILPVLLLGAYMFCPSLYPGHMETPSPTGEYVIEQRWTDFCAVGYRGKVYLVADGKRYYVNDSAPAPVRWLDHDTFEIESIGSFAWGIFDVADVLVK